MNKKDERYTPPRIFEALQCRFDLDAAAPVDRRFCHVPADHFITEQSLQTQWNGFVWLNPPYSGNKTLWLDKLYAHGNGIALMPDRTSAPWWPLAARQAHLILLVTGKIKFINWDGSIDKAPNNGSTLFAFGSQAVNALIMAERNGLGPTFKKL